MANISGRTAVAGVVGSPVGHSLSPLIHNAWLAAAEIDGVYVPFEPHLEHFGTFLDGLRGGSVRGLNVTLPFKTQALGAADAVDAAARAAGAANLLLFDDEGGIEGRNTDGVGLLAALTEQAPTLDLAARPTAVIGAGGAARGAVASLIAAGAPEVRILARIADKAEALAEAFGGPAKGFGLSQAGTPLADIGLVVNATSAGLDGRAELDLSLEVAPDDAVALDMVYVPLRTVFLRLAEARGLQTVDGLAMLIGQARPSFEALFGAPVPANVDARALALQALGEAP